MSNDILSENPPANPAPASLAPALPASATERLLRQPPGMISIMCPMGFTPYAIEGLTLDKPLFARVTYRPA
jgi:hypothetical protein